MFGKRKREETVPERDGALTEREKNLPEREEIFPEQEEVVSERERNLAKRRETEVAMLEHTAKKKEDTVADEAENRSGGDTAGG